MKKYLRIKKIALAVAFGFCSLVGFAQAPAIQWDKTIGGSGQESFSNFKLTSDGGYILGGTSISGISGDKTQPNQGPYPSTDYWVVKLDSNRNKIWDKTFGGNKWDELLSLAETTDGGFILGGHSHSDISGDKSEAPKGYGTDYWVVKLDSAGNKLWDRTIGGNSDDRLYQIIQTTNGGYLLGGYSNSNISGDKSEDSKGSADYWLVCLDSNGIKLWDKTIGGSSSDELTSMVKTADGGFILGGMSYSGISGNKTQANQGPVFTYDYWIVKLDSTGNQIWDKSFGGSYDDILGSLAQTTDGGYILGGSSGSGNNGDKSEPVKGFGHDLWIIRLDSAGNKVWDKTIGGNLEDAMDHVIETLDSGYLLCSTSNSDISFDKTQAHKGGGDFWVVKLDANGNKIWDKTIGGSGNDRRVNVALMPNGSYVLAGSSGSVISTDKSQNPKGLDDYWIVKLGPDATTGITEPTSTLNLSISPNPSQGKFQLQLNNLIAKTATITVSDIVGRTVCQQEIPVTGNAINQQINLPKVKGMYLLQVKAGAQTTSRKIVIE